MTASTKLEVQERSGGGTATVLVEYVSTEGETAYTVPEGVTEIAPWAFGACGTLRRVRLPESLRAIGEYAFDHCTGISEIVVPRQVMTIGIGAFHQCTGLRRVLCRAAKKPEGWVDYETISCCTADHSFCTEIRYYSWLFGVISRTCKPDAAGCAWRHILSPYPCKVTWNYTGD